MADDTVAIDPQERSPSVFRVVQPFFQSADGPLHQKIGNLRPDIILRLPFENGADRLPEPLADLQGHIAHKSIANDHIHLPAIEVPALDVANIVHIRLRQDIVDLPGQLIPFSFFLSVAQDTDPGFFRSQDILRIGVPHHGKLDEVEGFTVHIASRIDEDGQALQTWGGSSRWPAGPLLPVS